MGPAECGWVSLPRLLSRFRLENPCRSRYMEQSALTRMGEVRLMQTIGALLLAATLAIAGLAPGLRGYEGQPGNQGGHGGNGLLGYEGQPGNQGGH